MFTDLVFKHARVESSGEGVQHLLGATKRAFSVNRFCFEFVVEFARKGDVFQHVLGAAKRAFPAVSFRSVYFASCNSSEMFWNSDDHQRFPLTSTTSEDTEHNLSLYKVLYL